jgi:hypothetical protein
MGLKQFFLLVLFVAAVFGIYYVVSENLGWFRNWSAPRVNINMPRIGN